MKCTSLLVVFLLTARSGITQPATNTMTNWCDHPPRKAFSSLTPVKTSRTWFKVYRVGKGVFAICEPYNFEEVISYLVLGKKKALLFDTGMGFDSISVVVKELTSLPVAVLNSHTHFDHTGGNYEFTDILARHTPFTLQHAQSGWPHNLVQEEVTPEAFCLQRLPDMDTAHYHTRPFTITQFVKDGDRIDLGGRNLEIIAAPGHTPDAIALLDTTNGYLWTGDTFYEGPIYLFGKETDLAAYEKTIDRLASLVPEIKRVFPAHNNPVAPPQRLQELKRDFAKAKSGSIPGKENADHSILYGFQDFGLLFNKHQWEQYSKHVSTR